VRQRLDVAHGGAKCQCIIVSRGSSAVVGFALFGHEL
jgi:hypothetical protein